MPILFIALIISYILGNTYIFVRGLQALGQISFTLKILFSILYWVCTLLIFGIFAIRHINIPISIGHFLFRIGTSWLVFTLYMVIFLAIFDLLKVFNHSISFGFIISLILTICLLTYGYINYKHPNKQVFNIVINKQLKDKNKSLKIVAVSDLHIGIGTDKSELNNYVKMINAENPDLILIGGDLFDSGVAPVISQKMEEELNQLKAPIGVYMVLGNHEYISGINDCISFIHDKTKIKLLRDSIATLPCGLQIVGRDDDSNLKRLELSDLMSLVDKTYPVFILDHQPRDINKAQQLDADLQFSGHTHNGQIIPLNLLTKSLFEISYGYEKRGNTNFYVSSGLSLWGPPFRIGSNSEMVVFNCSFK